MNQSLYNNGNFSVGYSMEKYIVEHDGIGNCLNDYNWTPYTYSSRLYVITIGDVICSYMILGTPIPFRGNGCDVNSGEFILLFIGMGGIGLGWELGWNGT